LYHVKPIKNTIMLTAKENLVKAGLDWRVRKENIISGSGIEIPKKVVIIREDNNTPLGIHSNGYEIYQNEDFMELLYKISRTTGMELHSGGMFDEGGKVWFQLKSDDLSLNGDKIEGYISGINSFDGSTSLRFGNTNMTISCRNTFWNAYREMQSRFHHTQSLTTKLEVVLNNIKAIEEEEKIFFNNIKKLSDVKMDETVREMVTAYMFDLKWQDKLEDLSTVKKNKIELFNRDLNMELATKDDSLWGLFSGVTRYTTHSMKSGDNSKAKMLGLAGNKERAIWNKLVALV